MGKETSCLPSQALNQVHGIGAVAAAKLVERGIRSLAQLREAVEKHQVHLDAAQELTCFL